MENLIKAGQNALDTLETARLQKGVDQKLNQDTRSQYISTTSNLDAEQGILVAKTARGDFYTESITNRALDGGSVSQPKGATIGKIDEKPVFGPSDSLIDGNGTGDGVNDGSAGFTGDSGAGDPPEDGGDCSQQVLWYRGTPYSDPDEGMPVDCPYLGGQCAGAPYLMTVTAAVLNASGAVLTEQTRSANALGPTGDIVPYNVNRGFNGFNIGMIYEAQGIQTSVSTSAQTDANLAGYNGTQGGHTVPQAAPVAVGLSWTGGGGVQNFSMRVDDITVTRTDGQPDDCGNLPECIVPPTYGPPDTRPATEWAGVCIANPPARVNVDTNGDRTLLTIWDQATSKSNPLIRLDFEPGAFEYQILCKGEGPPT